MVVRLVSMFWYSTCVTIKVVIMSEMISTVGQFGQRCHNITSLVDMKVNSFLYVCG